MKKIVLIIGVFSFFSCKAQLTIYNINTPPEERTVTDNYYYKDIDNYNDSYVGVWKWEEGDSSFEITLQKFEMYSDPVAPNIYIDKLFGKYLYIENGEEIANISEIGTYLEAKVTVSYRTPTQYFILLRDIVSERYKVGEFTLISENTATLKLRDSGGVKVNYGNGLEWALPTSLTLTKQ